MIQDLSHLTFIVRNLDRMEAILLNVLGARKVYNSGNETYSLSRERFFVAGDPDAAAPLWIAIMEGESLHSRTYNHVAFKIDETDYELALMRIKEFGLDLRESRNRVDGEGRSIYFHDEDNHLFELHTGTLSERLARYRADTAAIPGRGKQ